MIPEQNETAGFFTLPISRYHRFKKNLDLQIWRWTIWYAFKVVLKESQLFVSFLGTYKVTNETQERNGLHGNTCTLKKAKKPIENNFD